MCGIAGLVGEWRQGIVQRMNKAQEHRGPDGNGVYENPDGQVSLGHVRLAILDLSDAAAQPMHSPDGRYVLSYNGEIYNYRQLGAQLRTKGHAFRSTSDTEVLLHAFMEWGIEALDKLNGIFAFALWDNDTRELLLVRDPLGVKPLYITELPGGALLFASEIKAMCVHPKFVREPDFIALQQHLAYCYASGNRTAFRNVRRLAPGHYLRWKTSTRTPETWRYWTPPFREHVEGTEDDAVVELRRRLSQACERQMVSDVPVGSLLSGGLDSSLVTLLGKQANANKPLKCFTISYPEEDNRLDCYPDDTPYARRLASQYNLPITEICPRPEVTELWPKLVYHLDEPIADAAAITSYLICKQARKDGQVVLLSGQGGDELFCGYPRFWVMQRTQLLDRLPLSVRNLIATMAFVLPGAQEGTSGAAMRRVRRVLTSAGMTADDRFLSYCATTPQEEILSVMTPDFRESLHGESFSDECLSMMEASGLKGQQRFQSRDLSVYLPNHNLLYTDKTSMAVGVEARVPLLDMDLCNHVLPYPQEWLVKHGETKRLLRRASRGIVPDSIIDRKKAGFGAPYRKWLREDLTEMWNELTSPHVVNRRGWFSSKGLERIREVSQSGKIDLYMLQWAILTVELWAQTFLDRNPTESL